MHPQLSHQLAEAHQAELIRLADRQRRARATTLRREDDRLRFLKGWRARRAAAARLVLRRARLAL